METALAVLRQRWGSAAPRRGAETFGALAISPDPETQPDPESGPEQAAPSPIPAPRQVPGERATPTGFRALDAILPLGGLPRGATAVLHGDGSSGKTTLALRAIAEAQAAGGVAAYLDLARALDPVEAVARGVQLDWLVVLTPDTLEDALAMSAMLLQDRAVDLLLLDLPVRLDRLRPGPELASRLQRLSALARRSAVELIVLEPPRVPAAVRGAIADVAALRLELSRRAWIRLGRDVVGQRTEVRVARDRFGAEDRTVQLRILYAEGGYRDECLTRAELLDEEIASSAAAVRVLRGAPPGAFGRAVPPHRWPRPAEATASIPEATACVAEATASTTDLGVRPPRTGTLSKDRGRPLGPVASRTRSRRALRSA